MFYKKPENILGKETLTLYFCSSQIAGASLKPNAQFSSCHSFAMGSQISQMTKTNKTTLTFYSVLFIHIQALRAQLD